MNDPRTSKQDVPPSPERDTSRQGREEEVINQREGEHVTNSDSNTVVNGTTLSENAGEQQFKEGTFDHGGKLDSVDVENLKGSDQTGNEESGLPGSGI